MLGINEDGLTADHHKVFLYQMLRGINFIHSSGVLHRDLKVSGRALLLSVAALQGTPAAAAGLLACCPRGCPSTSC